MSRVFSSMGTGMSGRDVHEEAERWFARLMAPDCSEHERLQFEQWRAGSAAHRDAFAAIERTMNRVEALAATDPRMEALLKRARVPNASSACTARASGMWRHRWMRPVALAASLLVAVFATYLISDAMRGAPNSVIYAADSARRTITLADGSVVQIDVHSSLTATITGKHRRVELQRGRALFEVAHDAAKPFIVRAGRGDITVLGTRFQVERRDESDRVIVTLERGAVAVSSDAVSDAARRVEQLRPGEQLTYADDPESWTKRQVDIDVATSWTRGRLVFRSTPLAEVVAEANRYGDRPIRLGDPLLAAIPVQGNFIAGNNEVLTAALAAALPLRVEHAPSGEIVLQQRE